MTWSGWDSSTISPQTKPTTARWVSVSCCYVIVLHTRVKKEIYFVNFRASYKEINWFLHAYQYRSMQFHPMRTVSGVLLTRKSRRTCRCVIPKRIYEAVTQLHFRRLFPLFLVSDTFDHMSTSNWLIFPELTSWHRCDGPIWNSNMK
jgi:hypothetical protein